MWTLPTLLGLLLKASPSASVVVLGKRGREGRKRRRWVEDCEKMRHHRKQLLTRLKRGQCGAYAFARNDTPIDFVSLVFTDNYRRFVLWHTCRVGMHERVLHQDASDFFECLVGSAVRPIGLPRYGIHTKVFLKDRGRGNLYFVITSSLQVQGNTNHVVGDCVRVDSACDRLGVRVCRGVDHL